MCLRVFAPHYLLLLPTSAHLLLACTHVLWLLFPYIPVFLCTYVLSPCVFCLLFLVPVVGCMVWLFKFVMFLQFHFLNIKFPVVVYPCIWVPQRHPALTTKWISYVKIGSKFKWKCEKCVCMSAVRRWTEMEVAFRDIHASCPVFNRFGSILVLTRMQHFLKIKKWQWK